MIHIFKNIQRGILFAFLLLFLSVYNLNAQEDNVIQYDIGSILFSTLSEGQQQGRAGILIGATEEMKKSVIPDGTFPNAVNAFLVEVGNKVILFDTGFGRQLFNNLQACKITPDEINAVVLTHMHGDHIGGLLRDNEKSFPNATLYIPQPEYNYWTSDEAMQGVPENSRGSFIAARKAIDAYKDKLQLFEPGDIDKAHELFPGIRSIAAYGHTPGHTGYMIESDGSKLFFCADLVHAMAIQAPFPEVAVTYDVDPVKAVESRQKLFKYLSDNKIRIAGSHIQFPALGNLKKNNATGYEFVLTCTCESR